MGGLGPVQWARGAQASSGVPRGRHEAARPGLGTEIQLQVDMWVQREQQERPARLGGWERAGFAQRPHRPEAEPNTVPA